MAIRIAIFALVLAAWGTVCAQPHFEIVGGLERNLGKIPRRDIHDTLIVHNGGSKPLRIIAINPTCGCTAASIDSNTVPPGGNARVFVTIDPPDVIGGIRKTIEFLTNDLEHPSTMFTYSFEILRDLGWHPASFAFAECQVDVPCRQSVTIINFSDTARSIVRQPFPVAGLRALLPDSVTIPPHDSLVYTLEWVARDPGLQRGRISLRTTSFINPLLEFTVIANVKDEKGNVLMPGVPRN